MEEILHHQIFFLFNTLGGNYSQLGISRVQDFLRSAELGLQDLGAMLLQGVCTRQSPALFARGRGLRRQRSCGTWAIRFSINNHSRNGDIGNDNRAILTMVLIVLLALVIILVKINRQFPWTVVGGKGGSNVWSNGVVAKGSHSIFQSEDAA